MKRSICLFFLLICYYCSSQIHAAKGVMPIIAYWGVPEQHTSESAFRTFRDCGFTVSIFPYSSLTALINACRQADKCGVKILGSCPELTKSHVRAASTLKNENGFFGYLIQDEPDVPQIHQRKKEIERLKQTDSTRPFYINLHPYYHPEWIEPTLKTKTTKSIFRQHHQHPVSRYPSTTTRLLLMASGRHGTITWRWCAKKVLAVRNRSGGSFSAPLMMYHMTRETTTPHPHWLHYACKYMRTWHTGHKLSSILPIGRQTVVILFISTMVL